MISQAGGSCRLLAASADSAAPPVTPKAQYWAQTTPDVRTSAPSSGFSQALCAAHRIQIEDRHMLTRRGGQYALLETIQVRSRSGNCNPIGPRTEQSDRPGGGDSPASAKRAGVSDLADNSAGVRQTIVRRELDNPGRARPAAGQRRGHAYTALRPLVAAGLPTQLQ